MRITILNGNPAAASARFEAYLERLQEVLTAAGHAVQVLVLRDLEIRHCTGCWGCWVKTPGECVVRDDSAMVCRAVINSDLTVFASPVIMGFTSALLKKTHDRLLPLLHPYLEVYQGEMHHRARYHRRPGLGLLIEPEPDTDTEDLAIIEGVYRRNAINLQSSLAFAKTTTEPVEAIANAIGGA